MGLTTARDCDHVEESESVMAISLVISIVILWAVVWLVIVLWRRQLALTGQSLSSDRPSSRTAATVETFAIGALGLVILTMTATLQHTHGLLLVLDEQSRDVIVYSVVCAALALVGYFISLACSWRGWGTAAVLAMFGTLTAYGLALNGSPYLSKLLTEQQKSPPGDVQLTIDISGCNVSGADLWANDVYLGKTPVRIGLSELLAQVPDWTVAPGREAPSSEDPAEAAIRHGTSLTIPLDKRWGTMRLPNPDHFELAESVANELRAREGRFIYLRVEYEGQPGRFGGSSGGSGSQTDFALGVEFTFPHRVEAIERLLDQARLVDYEVDEKWIKAAAAFGPDAWIAVREAAAHEPAMQQVFDSWVNWKYDLANVRDFDDAWQAFSHVKSAADEEGFYLTASPAGRAVEILVPRLRANQLIDAAVPIVRSTANISYTDYQDLFGERQVSVHAEGSPGLWLPGRGKGWFITWRSGKRFPPSGLALAHAIWLAHENCRASAISDDDPSPFQSRLTPELIRAQTMQQQSLALRVTTMLGGSALDKYLIRKADSTRDVDLRRSFANQEHSLPGFEVNRWVYWAAHLRSPKGVRFRRQDRDELYLIADGITQHLFQSDDIDVKLGFLFVENDLGVNSIGVEYWSRFCDIVRREQSYSALQLEVAYLIALEPAATVDMYVDAWKEDWIARQSVHDVEIVEPARQLSVLPADKRADVLDGLLAYFSGIADGQQRPSELLTQYALRHLREFRYDEIDDPASVEYQLTRLRGAAPPGMSKQLQFERFAQQLAETAAARPHLVEAIATAPEPEIRLLAIDALRVHPSPRNRELLSKLLCDENAPVRTAAINVQQHWDALREDMP